jgi:hypothetical protein
MLPAHVETYAALHASIPRTTRKQAVDFGVDVELMQKCTELKSKSIDQLDKDVKKLQQQAAERKTRILTATKPENYTSGDNINDLALRHGIVHEDMNPTEKRSAYKSLLR